jgi:uncharacterized YigZ family protein
MACHPEYHIPAEAVSTETEIKKSKFITTITAVTSKEEIYPFFQKIREQYTGANHNCFAYIVGNPKSPVDIGFSDDGEPSGTAGKPMLSVLQHNNIGNAAVMVTRFFGGTKLGTGGLVRAYSAAVKMAVEKISLHDFVASRRLQVSIPFQFESTVRHLLATLHLTVIDSKYSEDVLIELDVPEGIVDSFRKKVNDITKGGARFDMS